MLAYLQPETVRSPGGTLDGGARLARVYLRDDKIFTRVQQTDPGELSVDILLDGSTSQQERQTSVAAQRYMIAEALTRCHIPVRVSSFCSISGYTVVTRYRDYHETDRNEKIFNYFTAGCNRDGLALRALRRGMDDSPCEHKLLTSSRTRSRTTSRRWSRTASSSTIRKEAPSRTLPSRYAA